MAPSTPSTVGATLAVLLLNHEQLIDLLQQTYMTSLKLSGCVHLCITSHNPPSHTLNVPCRAGMLRQQLLQTEQLLLLPEHQWAAYSYPQDIAYYLAISVAS